MTVFVCVCEGEREGDRESEGVREGMDLREKEEK